MENDKKKIKTSNPQVITQKIENNEKKQNSPEIGGRGGLDPARFGDWEIAGKCVDF